MAMPLAGTKRPTSSCPILTVAHGSKRRKPLSQVAGNTATPRSVTQHVVTRGPPLSTQQHAELETIPSSSPSATKSLWNKVFAASRTTDSELSHLHSMAPKGVSAGNTRAEKRAVSESAAEETEDRTTIASTSRTIGPQHARFRAFVLESRGIKLCDQKPKARPPEKHFTTQLPKDGDYGADPSLSHASLWVSMNESRCEAISKHYSFMEKMRLSEDQFATYAKQYFFRCEEWELNLPHDRLWHGERIDTFVNPAEPADRWCAPPLLLTQQAASDGYRWDVRPDCAYWLSNRGFNEEYAEAIPGCCFVYRGWISNPYLTIEFKKNDWKIGVAATQLLTAAAIALYNRCGLSAQAGQDVAKADDLRHYGVTFEGSQFVVYVVRPIPAIHAPPALADAQGIVHQLEAAEGASSAGGTDISVLSWHGCEMTRLAQGDCTNPRDVQRLANWINEIHRWGITTYAKNVQRDIKSALADDGIDVSALDDIAQ